MTDAAGHRRPFWVDATILCLAAIVFVTLIALGNWQVRRLAWKLDLIEQIETRAYGAPVAMPQTSQAQEYLRVHGSGQFLHDKSVSIKAVTALGPGRWLMTPLAGPERIMWVNRGFVPTGLDDTAITRPDGPLEITGLVRLSQAGGTLLERNTPEENRWVSADLAEMSRAQGVSAQSDYYIDADHIGAPDAWPRGGLTKLEFRNSHLSYALTWYTMAALFFAAMVYVIRARLRGST